MFRQFIPTAACALVTIGVAGAVVSTSADQNGAGARPTCQIAGALVRVPELPEGSGLAASRRSPGRFWAHNDSGEPTLVALDSKGAVVGQLRLTGAAVSDWEAVAVGPCADGNCIYVGDIGDNKASRKEISIYRLPEPSDPSKAVERVDVLRARYPDGAHDAEALLVTPKGDILIVTKGETGPVGLYRLPSNAAPGAITTLQLVGKPRDSGTAGPAERITDGAVSPDGAWIALRTKTVLLLYRADDLLSGRWTEAGRRSLTDLAEPQGEGVAFGDDSTLYLVGEGGKKAQPGTFGRMNCSF